MSAGIVFAFLAFSQLAALETDRPTLRKVHCLYSEVGGAELPYLFEVPASVAQMKALE